MERVHIHIIIGVAFVAYFVALLVSIKGSHRVDNDFEFYNEDGDHIYYDCKNNVAPPLKSKNKSIAKRCNFKDNAESSSVTYL